MGATAIDSTKESEQAQLIVPRARDRETSQFAYPHFLKNMMMNTRFSRPAGTPLWLQIESVLANEILARALCGRLPNEQELATRFGVNRHTVRQAIQQLQLKGLVRIERGRGTFVQDEVIAYRLGKSTRFSHSLSEQHLVSAIDIQSNHYEPASEHVASMLMVPPGSQVLRVEALDLASDKVVSVCTQYFPLPRFDAFMMIYQGSTSTSEAFARCGISRFQRVLSRISARQPRPEVAAALQQGRQQPVLYVESVYADEDGQRIEYGITRFNGDTVQVEVAADAF
ncbi:phosphonate metabolism transcriptional regulator PhnF [Rhodobacteraceae bacterium CH30]|nr:phosphonate metabolism transcriptional regulator PhnF [Rhodobacteraceae bacterium CH30]